MTIQQLAYEEFNLPMRKQCRAQWWGEEGGERFTESEIDEAIESHLDGLAPTPLPDLPDEIVMAGMVPDDSPDASCDEGLEPCKPVIHVTVDVQKWIRRHAPQWLDDEAEKDASTAYALNDGIPACALDDKQMDDRIRHFLAGARWHRQFGKSIKAHAAEGDRSFYIDTRDIWAFLRQAWPYIETCSDQMDDDHVFCTSEEMLACRDFVFQLRTLLFEEGKVPSIEFGVPAEETAKQ